MTKLFYAIVIHNDPDILVVGNTDFDGDEDDFGQTLAENITEMLADENILVLGRIDIAVSKDEITEDNFANFFTQGQLS